MIGAIGKPLTVHKFITHGLACILFSSLGMVAWGEQKVSTPSGANPAADVKVPPGAYKSDVTILVHSDLVLIPVTVTDGSGKVVSGLEKEHFTLFEDATQQEITHFAAEDVPVSIGIVFDTSGSMEPRLRRAREAVNALLSDANPADELFLVSFNSNAQIVVPMTSQFEEIRNQVAELRANGGTALLDGVRLAMTEMTHARYSRKAIIIISDGEDNSSHLTVAELNAAVRQQDALIYAIRIADPADIFSKRPLPQGLTGAALLKEIVDQTGGCLFAVNRLKQLPEVAGKIGGWLRNQYVLGYVPNHSARDGSYRTVQLKVVRPKGYPRLFAIWRQGYYAPKE